MIHDALELSDSERQNLHKTIEKYLGLIRWAEDLGKSAYEYRVKFAKARELLRDKEFSDQFLHTSKFPHGSTLWYKEEFK